MRTKKLTKEAWAGLSTNQRNEYIAEYGLPVTNVWRILSAACFSAIFMIASLLVCAFMDMAISVSVKQPSYFFKMLWLGYSVIGFLFAIVSDYQEKKWRQKNLK